MCNSDQRRRSPDRMLHQTLSKGWCRDGSGLLLGLIVRPRGRLVEARPLFGALEPELRLLQRAFAEELSEPPAVYRVLDTTIIPAIVRVRASRKGLFAG